MATIANLVVEIKGRADQLNRTLSQASRRAQAFSRDTSSSFRSTFQLATRRAQVFGRAIATLGRRFRAMADSGLRAVRQLIGGFTRFAGILTGVVLVAIGLVVREIAQTADEIDKVAKQARALNIGVEAFQELAFAASLAGVQNEKLAASLRFMNRTIGETVMGMGAAGDAFDRLNIAAEDLQDLSIEEQFQIISQELRNITNASERAAIASKLFGAEGIFAVNQMIDGLEEARRQFRGLGVGLSQEQTEAVEAFNDARTRLLAIWTGFKQQVVAAVAPAFQTILENIQATIMANGGLQAAAQKTANFIISGANTAADFVKALWKEYQDGFPTLMQFADNARMAFEGAKRFVDELILRIEALSAALNAIPNKFREIGNVAGMFLTDPQLESRQQLAAQLAARDITAQQAIESGLAPNVASQIQRQLGTMTQSRIAGDVAAADFERRMNTTVVIQGDVGKFIEASVESPQFNREVNNRVNTQMENTARSTRR